MMLKEKINQAKSIIGVKAATIIAEELNIEQWDEGSLKGLCPFHNEDTPSFLWNKKSNHFKCFGCGEKYDILSLYQDSDFYNLSFFEATKKLFKETDMEYNVNFNFSDSSFFSNYRYPKEDGSVERNKVDSYMALRHINKKALDFAGIKEDKHGNIVYEHRDQEDKLVAVKYRPAKKLTPKDTKMWWQKDASTCPILYGVDKVDITKSLLIVEGHNDRLACIEAGYTNVVSIPHGAENYGWIEFNWDWLENFDKIILWSDNDQAGEKMIKEAVPRLGEHRCFTIEISNKIIEKINEVLRTTKADANNVLFSCGSQEVLNIIHNAKEVPISDIVDLMDCEDFDITTAEKISTGFNFLNKRIFAHVMGTFNIWTGYTGDGKSTILNQSCVAAPLDEGYDVFLFSGELMKSQLKNWVLTPLAGHKHILEIHNGEYQPMSYKITEEARKRMEDFYRGKVHLYDSFLNSKPKDILSKMEYLYKRKGVKIFVIDNLMCIDFDGQDDKWDAQKNFIMDLVNFSNKYGVTVHLVAHPKKPNGIIPLTVYDIFGSSNIPNLTHRIFSIRRVTEQEKKGVKNKKGGWLQKPIEFDTFLITLKDRITGAKDYNVGLYFDEKTKRFYGKSDNLFRKYKWDDGTIKYNEDITKKLVVNNQKDKEVLGEISK